MLYKFSCEKKPRKINKFLESYYNFQLEDYTQFTHVELHKLRIRVSPNKFPDPKELKSQRYFNKASTILVLSKLRYTTYY